MWAMKNQINLEITKILLEKCNFSLTDENGKTVLHYAAAVGNIAVVEMLFETFQQKKLVDSKDGNSHH